MGNGLNSLICCKNHSNADSFAQNIWRNLKLCQNNYNYFSFKRNCKQILDKDINDTMKVIIIKIIL